jgi:hypothetical protein
MRARLELTFKAAEELPFLTAAPQYIEQIARSFETHASHVAALAEKSL